MQYTYQCFRIILKRSTLRAFFSYIHMSDHKSRLIKTFTESEHLKKYLLIVEQVLAGFEGKEQQLFDKYIPALLNNTNHNNNTPSSSSSSSSPPAPVETPTVIESIDELREYVTQQRDKKKNPNSPPVITNNLNLSNISRDVSDEILAIIVDLFPHLVVLRLDECNYITNNGLSHISKLSTLQHLNVGECTKITDDGLVHLSNLRFLQHLNVNECTKITDAGILTISKFPSLQQLNLGVCDKITDDGLAHLSKLASLQCLDVSYCHKITDDGLKHLLHMPSLDPSKMDVNRTAITGQGFEAFKKQLLENQKKRTQK